MSRQALQYTVRGIPLEVDRILRKRATQRKQSLNQVIIDELVRAASSAIRRADFSDLVGRWTPDPEFDRVIASQRRIDPDKWK